MEIPGGRRAVTAMIAALGIGAGGLLLEYGYRQGAFNRDGIPRTRTDVDNAMNEVMARVARLESWEVGAEDSTIDHYFAASCGPHAGSDPKLLEYSDKAQRVSMVCTTKGGTGRVLEDGAWVESEGRLQNMSWGIKGGRAEGARRAILTVGDGGFSAATNSAGFGYKGVDVSCKPGDDGNLNCAVLRDSGKRIVALGESAGKRLLGWVKRLVKSRLENMREILELSDGK